MEILVLAAGRSSRMRGEDKLMRVIDGEPLLRRSTQRCLDTLYPVTVVTAEKTHRRDCLADLPCRIIEVPAGPMSASLVAGTRALSDRALLVMLADMPDLTTKDLLMVIRAGDKFSTKICRAGTEDGAAGHPVLFPASLLPDIRALETTHDQGAKDILAAREVHLVPLPGRHAVTDLDTPEAWAQWEAARQRPSR